MEASSGALQLLYRGVRKWGGVAEPCGRDGRREMEYRGGLNRTGATPYPLTPDSKAMRIPATMASRLSH